MTRQALPLVSGVAFGALALGCAAVPTHDGVYPAPSWNTPGYGWPPRGETTAVVDSNAFDQPSAPPPLKAKSAGVTSFIPEERGRSGTPEPTAAPLLERDACLMRLDMYGVQYRVARETRGIEVPVILEGPVRGVAYYANDRRPLLLDCRLGLALVELSPVLQNHGVTKVRFSGAYVYRNSRHGRLSLHANGLAIDIHELHFGETKLSVEEDFARNAGCDTSVPKINRVACDLRDSRRFQEFLTPDYDYDHRNHLHLAVPRRSNG